MLFSVRESAMICDNSWIKKDLNEIYFIFRLNLIFDSSTAESDLNLIQSWKMVFK